MKCTLRHSCWCKTVGLFANLVDVVGDLALHVVAAGEQIRQSNQIAALNICLVIVVVHLAVGRRVISIVMEVLRPVN